MTINWTPELENSIIELLANGFSLRRICRMDGMPDRASVTRHQDLDAAFSAKCAHARARGMDVYSEELEDVNERVADGSLDPAAARVIASNIQWTASKLAPKKYGESKHLDIDAKVKASINLVNEFPEE